MNFNRRWARFWFGDTPRIEVYRNLRDLIGDGLPIQDAIDTAYRSLAEHSDGRPRRAANSPSAVALKEWSNALRMGRGIGEAIGEWAPAIEQMLVISAERSSESLSSVFDLIISRLRAQRRLRAAMIKALTYPIVLVAALLGFLYVMAYKVAPQLTQSLRPDQITASGEIILAACAFVRDFWWLIPIFVIGPFVAILVSLPRWRGRRLRPFLDRFPPYSIFRFQEGTALLAALSALVATGTQLIPALTMLTQRACPYTRVRVRAIITKMTAGLSLGEAMDMTGYGFPDESIIQRLIIASARPTLPKTLGEISEEWTEIGVESIEAAAGQLFIGGVLVVGLVIVFTIITLLDVAMGAAAVAS
jgi:type II secretory pathway component PulF